MLAGKASTALHEFYYLTSLANGVGDRQLREEVEKAGDAVALRRPLLDEYRWRGLKVEWN